MRFNSLHNMASEYERIVNRIKPVTKSLLASDLETLGNKLEPGMGSLNWSSENIEDYLEDVHLALSQLEEFILKINRMIDTEIDDKLKTISKVVLVDLSTDSTTPEDFLALQEDSIQAKTSFLW